MKLRLLCISLVFRLCVTAQTFVTIPDSQFVHYLVNHVPNAVNGNQLDISNPAVTTMTAMIGIQGYTIHDLTGLQYFTSLKKIESINGLPLLTYIPSFPVTLEEITLPYSLHLKSLPPLPPGLKKLRVNMDSLLSLPTLPSTLISLECQGNPLGSLPPLPPGLFTLNCAGDSLTQLPLLPQLLHHLRCTDNQLSSLPALPDSLEELYCNINNITCFPPFPQTLVEYYWFDISENPFTCLPNYVDAMDSVTRAYPLCELGNQYGCEAVVQTSITIPNVFTPNGDNINDVFFIQATDVADLACSIYNRWGSLVYQFTNPAKGWDGKYKNGLVCSEGTYYYVVSFTDYKKNTVSKTGFLELLH